MLKLQNVQHCTASNASHIFRVRDDFVEFINMRNSLEIQLLCLMLIFNLPYSELPPTGRGIIIFC
jgi:hypothetical protein